MKPTLPKCEWNQKFLLTITDELRLPTMAATTLFITVSRPCENGLEFYVVNDESEAARNLAQRTSVVFANLAKTTAELEKVKEFNKLVGEEAKSEAKGKATKGKRRKLDEFEINGDADVQKLTDTIAEWLANKDGAQQPEGCVGSFDEAPKDLASNEEVRVGCGPLLAEGRNIAVFAVLLE